MLFLNGCKENSICLRFISLFVLFDFSGIFVYIVEKMLESNGNIYDFFYILGKNGKKGDNVIKYENVEDDFILIKLIKIEMISYGFYMSGFCCVRNIYVDS